MRDVCVNNLQFMKCMSAFVISEGQITQPSTVVVSQAVNERTLALLFTGEADSAVMPEEE
jgi:hypothetical protein